MWQPICSVRTSSDPSLLLFEPVVHPQRQVRVWPLPPLPRHVAPNFQVVLPCNSIPLRVKRWRGGDELVSGTICLGDRTGPSPRRQDGEATRSRGRDTRVEKVENQLWKISGRTAFGGRAWAGGGRGNGPLTRVTGISRSHNRTTRDFEAPSF